MGASRKVAPEVVGRVLALQRDAQAREVAVSLFKEGHSAVQVWEALVSSGVERTTLLAPVQRQDGYRDQAGGASRRSRTSSSIRPRGASVSAPRYGRRAPPWKSSLVIIGGGHAVNALRTNR